MNTAFFRIQIGRCSSSTTGEVAVLIPQSLTGTICYAAT
jgi:hypothetical protein